MGYYLPARTVTLPCGDRRKILVKIHLSQDHLQQFRNIERTSLECCSGMKFAMVKISRSRVLDYFSGYSSMIMEIGASPRWTNHFDTEDEMIAVVFRILAKQKQAYDLGRVLAHIRSGSGCYFFDLELTAKEAESLGYPRPLRTRPRASNAFQNSDLEKTDLSHFADERGHSGLVDLAKTLTHSRE